MKRSSLLPCFVVVLLSPLFIACPPAVDPGAGKDVPTETVASPAFSPDGGSISSIDKIKIGSTTADAKIRYTTDGTAPTETTGTEYTAPFSLPVSASTVVKAIAFKSGMKASAVVEKSFVVTASEVSAWAGSFNNASGFKGTVSDWKFFSDNTTKGTWKTTGDKIISIDISCSYTLAADGTLSISGSGTAKDTTHNTTSAYTIAVSGNLGSATGNGSYTITFTETGWGGPYSGTWDVLKGNPAAGNLTVKFEGFTDAASSLAAFYVCKSDVSHPVTGYPVMKDFRYLGMGAGLMSGGTGSVTACVPGTDPTAPGSAKLSLDPGTYYVWASVDTNGNMGDIQTSDEGDLMTDFIPVEMNGSTAVTLKKADFTVLTAGTLNTVHVSTTGNDTNDGSTASPLKSIQTAVLKVKKGGTVKVAAGTYNESVCINKPLTLQGGYDAAFTTSAPQTNQTILDGTDCALAGMSIAIPIAGASPTAEETALVDGFVVRNYKAATPDIYGVSGIVVYAGKANVTIKRCTAANCTTRGGAITVSDAENVTVDTSTITQNKSVESGGGIGIYNAKNVTVTSTHVTYNTAKENGAGVNIYNSETVAITSNVISDNTVETTTADTSGAGISIGCKEDKPFTVNVTYCEIKNNSGVKWGGGINSWESGLSVHGCIFAGNAATEAYGGGAVSWAFNKNTDVTFTLEYSDFTGGNTPNNVTGNYTGTGNTGTGVPDNPGT